MKILFFTDIHGSLRDFKNIKKKSKECDIIICAGDITFFEKDIEFFLSELDNLGKKVFMIHGNHEGLKRMINECKKYKNIYFIHKKIRVINDLMIIGYGGGGFSFEDKKFENFGKSVKQKISKHKGFVLLVTHAPPYGTKLDKLSEGHVGNISFREFIIKNKIDLVICGHLHENEGKKDLLGKTEIINPGPKGKIISL